MNATPNEEIADVFNRVKGWPLDMRITLAGASSKPPKSRPSPSRPGHFRSIGSSAC